MTDTIAPRSNKSATPATPASTILLQQAIQLLPWTQIVTDYYELQLIISDLHPPLRVCKDYSVYITTNFLMFYIDSFFALFYNFMNK